MIELDLRELQDIRQRIARYIHHTPSSGSAALSELCGCVVHLKQELFQKTGSYKPRGMLNALMNMSEEQRRRGVITFSAGNAAQGLAYAARHLGIGATVVMPATASAMKAQATRDYGAEVLLVGTPKECLAHCRQLAETRGLTFVSSYDDPDLMKGHASLGAEIFEDVPNVNAIFAGIGGGGMAGGLALARGALGKTCRLIGVEPVGASAMHDSIAAGHAVLLDSVSSVADGLAAPGAGEHCFPLVRDAFERVVLVEDDEIISSMRLLMERCKLFVEPAGAAALAGLLKCRDEFTAEDHVVCVVSGGNLDLARLKPLLW